MMGTIFDVGSIDEAKRVILMPEAGLSTEERWEQETAWLIERLNVMSTNFVVDYGCGIGRVSRVLAGERGCEVLGVDASEPMRIMANAYVAAPEHFSAVSPEFFEKMLKNGLQADAVVTAWCLQHIPQPGLDKAIMMIGQAIVDGGHLWTLERPERFIPAVHEGVQGWTNDGVSVAERLLHFRFTLLSQEFVPEKLCVPGAMLRQWRVI
jgi:cyclopropane fatty-acyl-phospholipid synthase-like methyltransferase